MDVFKFEPNRVWRVYRGGMGIDRMRGAATVRDGFFPEEWVASDTPAINPEHFTDHDGISMVKIGGKTVRFDELLKAHPVELLGERHVAHFGPHVGFLAKILDSAIRLPLQAHPNRRDARRLFDSESGKTEAWIVLGTRDENACLYMGFNERLDERKFRDAALSGDMTAALDMVHRYPVKPGDVLLVKGGMVHAIGPGVTLIEIMEPSDWCVQPERFCGDCELSDDMRFGLPGADPEVMLGVFDYTIRDRAAAWKYAALQVTPLAKQPGLELETCVDRKKIGFFGAVRATFRGEWEGELPFGSAASGIVISGALNIGGRSFTPGDAFFVPFDAGKLRCQGDAEAIFALPPLPPEP